MSTDNSNWRFSEPIKSVWGKQYVNDMANFYSINGDTSMKMTQAELCSLEEALNNALTSAPSIATGYGSYNFDLGFINFLETENKYSSEFIDKLKAWDLLTYTLLLR